VPQLLGVLVYFQLRKRHDILAHVIGFLLPPGLFFYLFYLDVSSSAQEIQSQGERVCGTYLGMMSIALLFGTGVQMFCSLIAQLALHARHGAINILEQS